MQHHHLMANAETCHRGFFDAARKPVLAIDSGDRVTVDCLTGTPDTVPASGFHIPPELPEVLARADRFEGSSHILTGPIAVRGAKPGRVLEVRILEVKLRQDWGYNVIRPLAGTLQDDFHERRLMHIALDEKRNVGRMPWGLELPLAPFFGIMGVAPPPAWGRITSIVPRAHGGNLDNKELVAGATLYLPIHVEGALFSCGDGHGAQGDGEVCISAVEMDAQVTLRFDLRRGRSLHEPQLRIPGRALPGTPPGPHFVTTAHGPDLFPAAQQAVRYMIDHLVAERGLSREEAYVVASVAVDLKISEIVDAPNWIVSAFLPESIFT
jgi:acetamidase/formamidase